MSNPVLNRDGILTVYGGLHYIRGNSKPYFSITADYGVNECGCLHERILKAFPQYADLVAMHLSDIDGVPMHAEANGWYVLAGYLGGMGERYHAGNGDRYTKPPTSDELLQRFADHCRVTTDEASAIANDVMVAHGLDEEAMAAAESAIGVRLAVKARHARARWAQICESMKPRWNAEAIEVIARFGLQVYGDKWVVVS